MTTYLSGQRSSYKTISQLIKFPLDMYIWLNSGFFLNLKLTDVRSDRVIKDQKLKLRVIHFLSLGHEIITTFWKFCWICCKINKQIPQQDIWKLLVKRGVDYKWGMFEVQQDIDDHRWSCSSQTSTTIEDTEAKSRPTVSSYCSKDGCL